MVSTYPARHAELDKTAFPLEKLPALLKMRSGRVFTAERDNDPSNIWIGHLRGDDGRDFLFTIEDRRITSAKVRISLDLRRLQQSGEIEPPQVLPRSTTPSINVSGTRDAAGIASAIYNRLMDECYEYIKQVRAETAQYRERKAELITAADELLGAAGMAGHVDPLQGGSLSTRVLFNSGVKGPAGYELTASCGFSHYTPGMPHGAMELRNLTAGQMADMLRAWTMIVQVQRLRNLRPSDVPALVPPTHLSLVTPDVDLELEDRA